MTLLCQIWKNVLKICCSLTLYEKKEGIHLMRYYQLPLGALQTNCYILKNDKNECIIIDPGAEGKKLIQFLNDNKPQPSAILLTHAHFDHIGAVDDIREAFQIPVYVHKKEEKWLTTPSLNGSAHFGNIVEIKAADTLIMEEQQLTIGSFTFEVFETPGHSPGSVSYYLQNEGYLFSGDVLFQGSVGRTDLVGGSMDVLMDSIHNKVLTLPTDTIVFPGHGPITLIENEMNSNPFLNGFN